jgi:hypothetical protein
MTINLSPNEIYTWLVCLGTVISIVVWVKITLARHETVLYDHKTGEVRVVTFDALLKIQDNCRKNIQSDSNHQNQDIKNLTEVINTLSKKIDQLSRCVTILAAGGDANDC